MRTVIKNKHGISIEAFTTLDVIPASDIKEIQTYMPKPYHQWNKAMKEIWTDFDQQLSSGHRLHNLVSVDGDYWYARLNSATTQLRI